MNRFLPACVPLLIGMFLFIATDTTIAREWKDASGKFKIEASFVRIVDDKVELKKPDGKLIQVAIAKLCDDDQKYLASIQKKSIGGSPDPALAALDEPCRIQPQGMKLGDFLKSIQQEHGVSVCAGPSVGSNTLEEVIENEPKDTSLEDVLLEVLQPFGLAWYEIEDTLVIASVQEAASMQSTRVYRSKKPNTVGELMRKIATTIAPDTWQAAGGIGSIQPFRNESLVIVQSLAVHEKIEQEYADRLVWIRGKVRRGEKEKQLDQQVQAQFNAVPLVRVVETLGEQTSVPISMDQVALDSAGVSSDTPVTLDLENAKLSAVLKLVLQPLKLMYEMQEDGSIKITSRDAGRRVLSQQSYAVLPLVSVQLGNGAKGIDAASLIQIIQSIQPSHWDVNGGEGTARFHPSGQLEVNQNATAHAQIKQLLADLMASTKAGK